MKILINTDHNVTLTEESMADMELRVESVLGRFDSQVTRVEVHLSDGSAGRQTGDDIRCEVEARPEGLDPTSVSHNASTPEAALEGSLRKMVSVLDTTFGRRDHHKGNSSMGGIQSH